MSSVGNYAILVIGPPTATRSSGSRRSGPEPASWWPPSRPLWSATSPTRCCVQLTAGAGSRQDGPGRPW